MKSASSTNSSKDEKDLKINIRLLNFIIVFPPHPN